MAKDKLYDKIGAFTTIPNTVVNMLPEIGTSAFSVFCYLRLLAGADNDDTWPSYDTIMEKTGLARKTVADAILKLEEFGLLERRRRFNQSTIYSLTLPPVVQKMNCQPDTAVQKVNRRSSKNELALVQNTHTNKNHSQTSNYKDVVVEEIFPEFPEPPTEPEPEPLPARPNIYTTYERNIGPLTPIIADLLDALESSIPATWPAEWFEKAVMIAVSANIRKLSYITGVIDNWKQYGYGVDTRPQKTKTTRPGKRDLQAELAAA